MNRLLKIKAIDNKLPLLVEHAKSGCIQCDNGSLHLDVNGQSFMVTSHSIFIYPAYGEIKVISVSEDFSGTICEVSHKFLLSILKTLSWSPNVEFISRNPIAKITQSEENRIIGLISLIASLTKENLHIFRDLELETLWQALAYEVINCYRNKFVKAENDSSHRDSIVVAFQETINRDITRHRDVRHYAKAQGLSARYFSTAIHNLTGHTPLYWISKAVVAEAQKLMLDSTLSLKEITYRLNFSSQTFFSRWYKQYAGETPTEFRQRNIHKT